MMTIFMYYVLFANDTQHQNETHSLTNSIHFTFERICWCDKYVLLLQLLMKMMSKEMKFIT